MEIEREGTVTISFVSFGKADQAQKTAQQMVKDLQVRQHNVIHATYNGGTELQINRKWSEPVLDHSADEPASD
jgi:hypothetical protein